MGNGKWQMWIGMISIMVCQCALSGCTEMYYWMSDQTRDVTWDREYWGGYRNDAHYVTQLDLFLIEDEGNPPVLIPPHARSDEARPARWSLEAYRANPSEYPEIRGVVPAGTLLRVCKVEHRTAINVDEVYVTGAFQVQGSGNRHALLDRISVHAGSRLGPDARYLRDRDAK